METERFTFVRSRCRQNLKFGYFTSLLCRGRHEFVLKCVLHVQHNYFSSFNQWYSCLVAFSFKTGSLSTRVFEARTATRSELFTLLTFLHTITFTLLSIISSLETISKKMWAPENPRHAKCSLPVAVRVSKTRVLKLTRDLEHTRFLRRGRQATKSKHFACQDSSVS